MSANWFRLESGQTVTIKQLFLRVSDEGFLEGTPERIARTVLKGLPATIARIFWQTEATLILHPEPGPLPAYTFIAHLSCPDTVPNGEEGYYSRLIVAWFQDDLSGDIAAMAHTALRAIDWNAHAENWVD